MSASRPNPLCVIAKIEIFISDQGRVPPEAVPDPTAPKTQFAQRPGDHADAGLQ